MFWYLCTRNNEIVTFVKRNTFANIHKKYNMSKNNFEILTEVYSGTSIGERIKKREQVISDYLNVYGQLILNEVLKPTPVMEHLAKKYNFSRCGVLKILKEAGIYHGRSNPVVYPSELNNKTEIYGTANRV